MRISTPVGHHVAIRGQDIWTHKTGQGDPAVVFVPGAGSFGLDFALVQERVSKFATAILYDRAGTGWSDDTALPRTATEVTDELGAVLLAIAGPGPYVLVGHSLGGAYVQRFAQRFPAHVAGLVLLDPAHEDWNLYMPEDVQIRAEDIQEVERPPRVHRARSGAVHPDLLGVPGGDPRGGDRAAPGRGQAHGRSTRGPELPGRA